MKDPHEIIDHLSPTDALSILRTLADSDEGLAYRIAEMATAHLSEVDPEEVATVLYDELDALEVEDVWDRAGRTRHGYVEPGEAADQMIEEVLDPFLTENVPVLPHQITGLASRRGQLHYEAETPPGATLGDLDLGLLEGYRATYDKRRGRRLMLPDLKLLEHLGAIVYCEGEPCPTVAGLLVFGREVWRHVPQSRLSIVRYPGPAITRNILDARELEGGVPDMIDQATDYLSERMQVGAIRDVRRFGPRREDVPEYPLPALREIITNALAHREYQVRGARVILKWFSDRIEVSNPGELMEPITPATIYTTRPVHRNPNLMKMLYGYGYVEGYGDGLPMVRTLFEEHPLRPPRPRFEEVPGSVIVTLYAADLSKLAEEEQKARWAEMGLSNRQITIMTYLAEHGRITTRECCALLGVSERTARTELSKLVTLGLIVARGRGRNRHYILP